MLLAVTQEDCDASSHLPSDLTKIKKCGIIVLGVVAQLAEHKNCLALNYPIHRGDCRALSSMIKKRCGFESQPTPLQFEQSSYIVSLCS